MRILRGAMHVGTDLSSYCVWTSVDVAAVHRVLLSQEHLYGCETKHNVPTQVRSGAIDFQCAC